MSFFATTGPGAALTYMGRARASAVLFVVLSLSASSTEALAASGDAPAYSPLPPPPPPPAEPGARPVPRAAVPTAKPAPPAPPAPPPASSAEGGLTTTSSASLPAAEPAPHERSRPALDDGRFSISPLVGFGTNNLELGAGVRAGAAAIAPHLWVGGTFVFHNGTSASGTVANNVHWEVSSSLIYFGPEVGYDFELGSVIVRPYGGVGPGLFRVSSVSANISASETATKLLVWTGGTVLYGIRNTSFFVGADARLLTVPAGPALALYALGGMSL